MYVAFNRKITIIHVTALDKYMIHITVIVKYLK